MSLWGRVLCTLGFHRFTDEIGHAAMLKVNRHQPSDRWVLSRSTIYECKRCLLTKEVTVYRSRKAYKEATRK